MSHKSIWTFAITSFALFMVTLDNLVVSTALPVIRVDLHASLSELEWTVNAYSLTFAVLLLTGAALGDRLGRRSVFVAGLDDTFGPRQSLDVPGLALASAGLLGIVWGLVRAHDLGWASGEILASL